MTSGTITPRTSESETGVFFSVESLQSNAWDVYPKAHWSEEEAREAARAVRKLRHCSALVSMHPSNGMYGLALNYVGPPHLGERGLQRMLRVLSNL